MVLEFQIAGNRVKNRLQPSVPKQVRPSRYVLAQQILQVPKARQPALYFLSLGWLVREEYGVDI